MGRYVRFDLYVHLPGAQARQVPVDHVVTAQCTAQAYGARNYGALGVVLQQAIVITTLTFGCTFLVWTQLHHVLLFAGLQPPCPSKACITYLNSHCVEVCTS